MRRRWTAPESAYTDARRFVHAVVVAVVKLPFAACLLLWSQIAWGGVALVATSLPGAPLRQGPAEISLVFSEAVRIRSIQLVDPQGQAQPLYAIQDAAAEIHIPVPPDPRYGAYTLNWRVVAVRGDAADGTLSYEVVPPGILERILPASVRPLDAALWLAALLLWAAAIAGMWFGPQFLSATVGLFGAGLALTGFQLGRLAALWRAGGDWGLPLLCGGGLAVLLGTWLARRRRR
jgi:methionine-rich copper-binding protein CopC